jgi:hypothetical protein
MKKTLLIAAAALAASVISSQAQVYSQNIVGYVNSPLAAGFVNVANPLDASDASGVNNSITNVINVFSGNYDGDGLYIWTGATYAQYTIDSGQSTGIGNAADTAAVAPPKLAPGSAIFIANGNAASTNTFVGAVHRDGAATGAQVVGVTTNTVGTGFQFIASKLSIGGGISSVLGLPADGSLDGSSIYIPNISGGAVHGFTQITVDSGQSTGFGNAADTAAVAEPVIPVGTGFFFFNGTGAPFNWVQGL